MYTLVSVLIIIVCVLLVLIVLVQNSKGGGLASSFSSSNQIMGVRKTADFLEKATWTLAGSLLFLCLVAAMTIPRAENDTEKSLIEQQLKEKQDPTSIPAFPTEAPATDKDTSK
ncbi:MAG: preprotein translocase subunit SecG [Marinifilaceae bacterium]|jgi:preprotein translocase subunit SecG